MREPSAGEIDSSIHIETATEEEKQRRTVDLTSARLAWLEWVGLQNGLTGTDLRIAMRIALYYASLSDTKSRYVRTGHIDIWPSIPTLAREIGADARNVQRSLKRLEDKGALQITHPGAFRGGQFRGGGRARTNVYRLIPRNALTALAGTDAADATKPRHASQGLEKAKPRQNAHVNPGKRATQVPKDNNPSPRSGAALALGEPNAPRSREEQVLHGRELVLGLLEDLDVLRACGNADPYLDAAALAQIEPVAIATLGEDGRTLARLLLLICHHRIGAARILKKVQADDRWHPLEILGREIEEELPRPRSVEAIAAHMQARLSRLIRRHGERVDCDEG